ncbi:hypothetical protein JTE90_015617 [Oedothorax gibbosus]|uniref:Uncharacterized protein n=1 Tax=Oedothorax gibbosus TaxID=931172 RepID=A0AAV6UTL5_9ARAC|nr:hypothetical protein JTE90_015617 [Oedothorax gibbosus]
MDSIRYSEKGWSYRLNSSSCVQVILWLALSGVETAKRIEVCRFQQATYKCQHLERSVIHKLSLPSTACVYHDCTHCVRARQTLVLNTENYKLSIPQRFLLQLEKGNDTSTSFYNCTNSQCDCLEKQCNGPADFCARYHCSIQEKCVCALTRETGNIYHISDTVTLKNPPIISFENCIFEKPHRLSRRLLENEQANFHQGNLDFNFTDPILSFSDIGRVILRTSDYEIVLTVPESRQIELPFELLAYKATLSIIFIAPQGITLTGTIFHISAASTSSLYRPPPHPPSIAASHLPLSAASTTSLYQSPPQPPSISRLLNLPLSVRLLTSLYRASSTSLYQSASSTSLYRPPPQPSSIGRLLTLPLSAASTPSLYPPPPHPPSIGRLHNLPLSAASSTSLYRPPPHPPSIGRLLNIVRDSNPLSLIKTSTPPHPPSIGRLLNLPLSAASATSLYRPPPNPPSNPAASSTSLYRPPPQPPSIGRLRNLPLSAASSTSLYRPPPQPPSIGRLHNLPLSAASTTSLYRPNGTESSIAWWTGSPTFFKRFHLPSPARQWHHHRAALS